MLSLKVQCLASATRRDRLPYASGDREQPRGDRGSRCLARLARKSTFGPPRHWLCGRVPPSNFFPQSFPTIEAA